jgi:hypothetical protein
MCCAVLCCAVQGRAVNKGKMLECAWGWKERVGRDSYQIILPQQIITFPSKEKRIYRKHK